MNDREFLGKRRDRAIATILGFKETNCDAYLPDDVSFALRKTILDQMNDLCELAFDLLSEDVVYNDLFWDKLEEIHSEVKDGKKPK